MYSNNNALQLFKYAQNNVRIITQDDGSIWFVAADVARVLGIQNIRQNLNELDDDEKATVCITYARSKSKVR